MTCSGMPHSTQAHTPTAIQVVLQACVADLMPTSAISPKLRELLLKLEFPGDMLSRFAFRGPDARLPHSRTSDGSAYSGCSHWL